MRLSALGGGQSVYRESCPEIKGNVMFVHFSSPMDDLSPHSPVRLLLRVALIETCEQNLFIGILHWTLSIV
jgi:hypothetical protein